MKEDRNKITALHNNVIRCINQSICQQEQWLALLPDSQKGLRSNPPSGQGLSVDLSLSFSRYIYIYIHDIYVYIHFFHCCLAGIFFYKTPTDIKMAQYQ